jgi:hypothetical protein
MADKKNKKKSEKQAKKPAAKVPSPPGPDSSFEEIDEYVSLANGHETRPLTEEEAIWASKLSQVAKERIAAGKRSQLNLALSPDQLVRFTAYANRKHIPPSTLARAWVLERLDAESENLI